MRAYLRNHDGEAGLGNGGRHDAVGGGAAVGNGNDPLFFASWQSQSNLSWRRNGFWVRLVNLSCHKEGEVPLTRVRRDTFVT